MKKIGFPSNVTAVQRTLVEKEIEMMKELRHPNLLLLIGYIITLEEITLFTQLMDCNLSTIIKSKDVEGNSVF